MSNSTLTHPDHETARALTRRQAFVQALMERLIWWPLLLASSAVWFFFGLRLMRWLGPDALGPGAGVMLATAVGMTLWRWSVRDARRETVAAGTCPRCAASITRFEERPRPGALALGLQGWRCHNCGLEHSEPLTAERDPS